MKVKVRTHPIDVFYLTGTDAYLARSAAGGGTANTSPCFVTAAFGMDGFAWDSCEDFESDYRMTFSGDGAIA